MADRIAIIGGGVDTAKLAKVIAELEKLNKEVIVVSSPEEAKEKGFNLRDIVREPIVLKNYAAEVNPYDVDIENGPSARENRRKGQKEKFTDRIRKNYQNKKP